MLRIRGVTKDGAQEEIRGVLEEQEKRWGSVLNTTAVYALRPTILRGVQALAEGIRASGLIAQELRHLVCVKTASINGCPY